MTSDAYDATDEAADADILVVMRGMLLPLPDGRAVLISPAASSEVPDLHFFLAAMLLDGQSPPRPALMSGMGWGFSGELYLPEQQPQGAFHVWQEGGPEADRWLGVTDLSGASPAPLGVFPSLGEYRCRDDGCDQRSYRLTSIRYADTGPGRLTLKWDVQLYQDEADCALEQACGRHEVGRRIYVANYLLTSNGYALLGGEEPLPE